MITARTDGALVERIDALVEAGAYESRAAFIIEALERLARDLEREAVDRSFVAGYTRNPQTADETDWAEWSASESIRIEPW